MTKINKNHPVFVNNKTGDEYLYHHGWIGASQHICTFLTENNAIEEPSSVIELLEKTYGIELFEIRGALKEKAIIFFQSRE